MKNIFYAIGQEFPVEELNYELDYENTIQSTAYDAIEEIINQKILMFINCLFSS